MEKEASTKSVFQDVLLIITCVGVLYCAVRLYLVSQDLAAIKEKIQVSTSASGK